MKEVPNVVLPEISGGDQNPNGSTPLPSPSTNVDFPRNPFSPVCEMPYRIDE